MPKTDAVEGFRLCEDSEFAERCNIFPQSATTKLFRTIPAEKHVVNGHGRFTIEAKMHTAAPAK